MGRYTGLLIMMFSVLGTQMETPRILIYIPYRHISFCIGNIMTPDPKFFFT